MSRNRGSGGGAVIAVILLILLAGVLYQCNGAKYGLPVIPMGSASSSSAASPVAGEPAASETASVAASAESSAPGGFTYLPATDLAPWSWTSSTVPLPWAAASNTDPGYRANVNVDNWSPAMCFPLEGKAYANSQVYRPGGEGWATPEALASKAQYDAWYNKAYSNPKQSGWLTAYNNLRGTSCDPSNYQYPWRDNFCEKRSGDNSLCHSAKGHQGQDIRPETCQKSLHWAVAAEDSVIKDVGSYTLTLRAVNPPYRIYRYLHMDPDFIAHWQPLEGTTTVVKAGRRLGRVGDFGPGGTSYTTVHLHFEIRLSVAEQVNGTLRPLNTFVPPYNALVASYERKLAGNGCESAAW
ncbi:hypothetical protein ABAC460_05020 [Asticcacaulis sp. AC460]|uniref:hypothetical protein n=1 Tax=Asticcacaulis sp. AC460 TaxID=1282360 RepID=UPI0003C40CAB|nr:hypothetical protein [Asticcacaulis sp. AC460]ESQ91702.1 hypothetical protein ABAC460_05020 [Asticcacaulis sp. AC460]